MMNSCMCLRNSKETGNREIPWNSLLIPDGLCQSGKTMPDNSQDPGPRLPAQQLYPSRSTANAQCTAVSIESVVRNDIVTQYYGIHAGFVVAGEAQVGALAGTLDCGCLCLRLMMTCLQASTECMA